MRRRWGGLAPPAPIIMVSDTPASLCPMPRDCGRGTGPSNAAVSVSVSGARRWPQLFGFSEGLAALGRRWLYYSSEGRKFVLLREREREMCMGSWRFKERIYRRECPLACSFGIVSFSSDHVHVSLNIHGWLFTSGSVADATAAPHPLPPPCKAVA